MPASLDLIHQHIISCNQCPRLREHCKKIALEKRKSFKNDEYWGKPVPGFGDPQAQLMIVGLAPAAHGANRTGRIFTGDRSGEWLYRALYKSGFANQALSSNRKDGLKLKNTYISCIVRCAPPENKPHPGEQLKCSEFLAQEIQALREIRIWLALGQIALNGLWPLLQPNSPRPPFKHNSFIPLGSDRWLALSYHPSQQNTFTGRLTEPMFDSVFTRAKQLLS